MSPDLGPMIPVPLEVDAAAEYWPHTSLPLAAILYYDYFLTVIDEVEHFWKSATLSPVSVLFAVNRYLGLLAPVAIAVEYFGNSSEKPKRRGRYGVLMQLLFQISMFTSLTYLINAPQSLPFRQPNCDLTVTNEQASVRRPLYEAYVRTHCGPVVTDVAIAWSTMLWFDTAIFLMTLVKALRTRHNLKGGLLEIMLRDGKLIPKVYGYDQ
ncbi:hypothetical protein C8Q79DRAFT_925791 [Trametes meyenii]|nr:hypothetical protein C8Q79DRAFT_925791 [Trametes meyenii]